MTADIKMLAVSPYTDRILAAVQRKDCADPLYQILQDYARAVAEYNVENLRRERDAAVYALANTERSLAAARKARDLFADRAEQLAEALRECIALGHPRDPAIIAARAALRDHDQEGKDG